MLRTNIQFKKDEIIHLLKLGKLKLIGKNKTRLGDFIRSYEVTQDFTYNYKRYYHKDIFQIIL